MSQMLTSGSYDVVGIQDLNVDDIAMVDGGGTVGEAFLIGAGVGGLVGSVGGVGGAIGGAVIGGIVGVALYYVP